jgi:hypothetical protein
MATGITDDPRSPLAPVLRLDLLDRLHALNADYLELLAAERKHGNWAAQLQYFPARLCEGFDQLSDKARLRICRTPYALYSLRFEEERFWRLACRPICAPLDIRYSAQRSDLLQGAFCETALIEAWQTARAFPLAARLIYAMNESVRTSFAALPLWQVKRLASDHPSLLVPRWPANAGFWPDLLAFALADDARLSSVQLLGTQLISAELAAVQSRARGKHAIA